MWTYSYWFQEGANLWETSTRINMVKAFGLSWFHFILQGANPPLGASNGDVRRMPTSWYSAFWTRAAIHKLCCAASTRRLELFGATYIWATSMNRRWRLPTWRCNVNSNVEAWPACCWKAVCGWLVNAESGPSMRSPSMWQHEMSMRFDFMRAKASSTVDVPRIVDVPRGKCRPFRSGVPWRNSYYDSIVTMIGFLGRVSNSVLAKAHLVASGYLTS